MMKLVNKKGVKIGEIYDNGDIRLTAEAQAKTEAGKQMIKEFTEEKEKKQ